MREYVAILNWLLWKLGDHKMPLFTALFLTVPLVLNFMIIALIIETNKFRQASIFLLLCSDSPLPYINRMFSLLSHLEKRLREIALCAMSYLL